LVYAGPTDTTPPIKPTVTVDGAIIYGNTIHGSWSSSDSESGIYSYMTAVSTTTTDSGIVGETGWENFGTETEGNLEGLPLQAGQRYYVIGKAMNGAGLWSQVGASRAFTVDKAIGKIEIVSVPEQEGETFVAKAKGALQFAATVYDEDDLPMLGKKITWWCNPSAGKISKSGKFTAGCTVGEYSECITATVAGSVVTGKADVKIVPGDPYKVLVTPTNVTLDCAATQSFAATVVDKCGNPIEDAVVAWSVKNSKVGAIDAQTGLYIAGPNPGRYSSGIIAVCGTKRGRASVVVTAPPPSKVDVIGPLPAEEPYLVEVGKTKKFSAIGYDSLERPISGLKFSWSVSEGTPGKVSSSGLFSAGKVPGSGLVKAQALINKIPAGEIGLAEVDVIHGPPNKVSVIAPSVTLTTGQTYQFGAKLVDRFGNEVEKEVTWTWACMNAKAGSLDSMQPGLFTAGAILGSYGACVQATATYDVGVKIGKATVKVIAATP